MPYFWLQPAVTGAVAILVLLGAGLTIRQRYRADRKDQWWKRTQWAFELLFTSDEDREVLGLMVLEQQAAAKAADKEDSAFIAEVVQPVVDAIRFDDTEVVPPSDGRRAPQRTRRRGPHERNGRGSAGGP